MSVWQTLVNSLIAASEKKRRLHNAAQRKYREKPHVKKQIRDHRRSRYNTDPEFRARLLAQSKAYYERTKAKPRRKVDV